MRLKINFACSNCLNIFDVETIDIRIDKQGELHFVPIPECTYCGATEEVVLSHFGLEQIDHLLFRKEIEPL
jgi:hypothetical protein